MARKELKELLYANPNEFWRLVGQLGIGNPDVSAVLKEAETEMDGSGVEEFEAAFLQEW
jgi:hypothetical protein